MDGLILHVRLRSVSRPALREWRSLRQEGKYTDGLLLQVYVRLYRPLLWEDTGRPVSAHHAARLPRSVAAAAYIALLLHLLPWPRRKSGTEPIQLTHVLEIRDGRWKFRLWKFRIVRSSWFSFNFEVICGSFMDRLSVLFVTLSELRLVRNWNCKLFDICLLFSNNFGT